MDRDAILANWRFKSPPNEAVISTTAVIRGGKPILYVCHDDDGYWQYHDGRDAVMANAMVVSLLNIVMRDTSVAELADLPYGWKAERYTMDSEWIRAPEPELERDEENPAGP